MGGSGGFFYYSKIIYQKEEKKMTNNLMEKGYRNKATTFEWEVKGEHKTTTSNAVNFEKAKKAAGLPEDARLLRALTVKILDGKGDSATYVDVVWSVEGVIPSAKAAMEYLVEKGAITEAQAKEILEAKETRL